MPIQDTSYARWARGACPCCGGILSEWVDGTKPAALAEGVMFCGRCIANEHDRPEVLGLILTAIAERSDRVIEEHLRCP